MYGLSEPWPSSATSTSSNSPPHSPACMHDAHRRTLPQQRLAGQSSSGSSRRQRYRATGETRMEVFEGNPVGKAIWEWVWKLPIMQRGAQGAPIQFGDVAHVLRKNIEQIYGTYARWSGACVCELHDQISADLIKPCSTRGTNNRERGERGRRAAR